MTEAREASSRARARANEMAEIETTYQVIKYEDCEVNDYVIIESGEEEKWQGQIKAKRNGKLCVRWLRPWKPKTDEEDCGQTGLYDWDPYDPCDIDVETLIEIGPKLFHKVRRPNFEPIGKVFCLSTTCNGRCVAPPEKRKVSVKTEPGVAVKRPRGPTVFPPDAVEWETNVMGECKPCDLENHPFEYVTKRIMDDETETRPESVRECFSSQIYKAIKHRLPGITKVPHSVNAGDFAGEAILTGRIIHPLAVKNIPNKGYGIFACDKIPKGAFICEYIGEIIDKTEAKKREEQYIRKSQFFLHDVHGLRNHESFGAYTLDTTNKGNVGRMINHSCEPNASTIELLTPVEFSPIVQQQFQVVPRIVFIAITDIEAGEEICIDYCPRRQPDQMRRVLKCFCGKPSCRDWVF